MFPVSVCSIFLHPFNSFHSLRSVPYFATLLHLILMNAHMQSSSPSLATRSHSLLVDVVKCIPSEELNNHEAGLAAIA